MDNKNDNIEKTFEEFINALKNLSDDEINKLYDNMQKLNDAEIQKDNNIRK